MSQQEVEQSDRGNKPNPLISITHRPSLSVRLSPAPSLMAFTTQGGKKDGQEVQGRSKKVKVHQETDREVEMGQKKGGGCIINVFPSSLR